MTPAEAKLLEPYFDVKEIEATGAKLEDVSLPLMLALVEYRKVIGVALWLLEDGLTTGDHEDGSYHFRPEGAVDFYHGKPVKPDLAVENMLRAGFNGIGVYWNGNILSFHGDRRPKETFWRGTKKFGEKKWTYDDLVKVP